MTFDNAVNAAANALAKNECKCRCRLAVYLAAHLLRTKCSPLQSIAAHMCSTNMALVYIDRLNNYIGSKGTAVWPSDNAIISVSAYLHNCWQLHYEKHI